MLSTLIDFLVIFLLPTMVMFSLVASIHWLSDRIFGYDPQANHNVGFYHSFQSKLLQNVSSFAARKERESKATPRYDALVDEEWRARRLEERFSEEDASEVHSLAELLESRGRK
jgi:hypothetical protein